jgi:hypothetical protein
VSSPQIETGDQPSLVMFHLSPPAEEITLNHESRLRKACRGQQRLRQSPISFDATAAAAPKKIIAQRGKRGRLKPSLNQTPSNFVNG